MLNKSVVPSIIIRIVGTNSPDIRGREGFHAVEDVRGTSRVSACLVRPACAVPVLNERRIRTVSILGRANSPYIIRRVSRDCLQAGIVGCWIDARRNIPFRWTCRLACTILNSECIGQAVGYEVVEILLLLPSTM